MPKRVEEAAAWLRSIPAMLGKPEFELIAPLDEIEICAETRIWETGTTMGARSRCLCPMGPDGRCYENAGHLASAMEGQLAYAEGFAVSPTPELEGTGAALACWHGWTVGRLGEVVAPTWPDGLWYHGVLTIPGVADLMATGGRMVGSSMVDLVASGGAV